MHIFSRERLLNAARAAVKSDISGHQDRDTPVLWMRFQVCKDLRADILCHKRLAG